MPRKSLVEQLVSAQPEEINTKSLGSESILILYRFNENPSHRYYKTLDRLKPYIAFNRPQNGVLETKLLVDAYTLTKLITHYGGESKIYQAQVLKFLE